jgi:hypothetical protein
MLAKVMLPSYGPRSAVERQVTSTRMLARIEDWKEGHGKARGRAETDRMLSEARQLLTEIQHMLADMRGELLGSSRQR